MACAGPGGHPKDPLEPLNRATFRFNDVADQYVMRPVAQVYELAPLPLKVGVGNFFGNIGDLWIGVNNLLQGKVVDGFSDGGRFLVNSTVGLLGVFLVAKPSREMFNWLSFVGISSSFLAAMAFVTVRALTQTESATRIVFYFCLISTVLSAIPMYWYWRALSTQEVVYLVGAGSLATFSQICLSKAYGYAPAGKIGPANYLAIIFAGVWAWLLWQEVPDTLALVGMLLIFIALLLCLPRQFAHNSRNNNR